MYQRDRNSSAKAERLSRQDLSRTVCSNKELLAVKEPRLSYSVKKSFKHGRKKSFLGFSTAASNKFDDPESERRHKEAI